MNPLKSKKFRQGAFSTIITIVGLALILLLASVLSTLADRFNWQVDMTTDSIFSITEETEEFLAGLDKDVAIYVLNSEDGFSNSSPQQYFTQANEIIQTYARLSDHITVRYVDILKDPSFVSQYTDQDLKPNSILLVSDGQTNWFESTDLFNTQQTQRGTAVTSSRAEQTLTSAILRVTSDEKPIVTFLGGHDEMSLEAYEGLLDINNYEVTHTNILNEEIDPSVDVAVIVAPARDFTEDELRKIDSFLENGLQYGKTVLYAASYNQPEHENFPNLNAFLAEWGLGIGESLLYEADTRRLLGAVSPFLFLTDYTDSDWQPELKGSEFYNAMMYSRPVEILFEQKGSRTTTSLLETTETSGIVPPDAEEDWMFSESDLDGPHSTLAMSTQLTYDGTTPLMSHVIVLGSTDALAASSLDLVNLANSDYFVSLFDKLTQRKDTVRITPKAISEHRMELTYSQAITISRIFYIALPVLLVAVGLVIWLRRRHR